MKYFPLVSTALRRKPVEAVLMLLAITVAFTLFGLMLALNETYRQVIDLARMDRIYVTARFGAVDGLPLALRDRIARIDGVTGVGAFRVLTGYHRDPRNFASVWTADDGMRLGWSEMGMREAQWDMLRDRPTGVYVSRRAAERFGLGVGDTFPLVSAPGTKADGSTSWAFDVLGLIDDNPEFSNGVVIGNFSYYDNERPADVRGMVHGFRLAVDSPERANEISRSIDRTFANSGTPTVSIPVRANAENMANSVFDIATMTWTVAGAGLFMILFLTANALAESVRERVPEFAVLKTLGFGEFHIAILVFVEAAVPCIFGAVLGTGLAAEMTGFARSIVPADVFFDMRTPELSLSVLFWAVGAAALLASASTLVPVLRLERLDVAVALTGR